MAELLLDPAIRFWVFLPLVIITFFYNIIRHYLTIMMQSDKKPDLNSISDTENGKYLTPQAFFSRKHYFNNEDNGILKIVRKETPQMNIMTDPNQLSDMLKGNMLNLIPMLVIGGWINWAFSGFLTTKIPFLLTYRFKPMLQRGCESLVSLDAAWVSSASWYFLNIFGLRSMYSLILGSDNNAEKVMHEQMMPTQGPPDPKVAFKTEWESLEILDHKWALENIERKIV